MTNKVSFVTIEIPSYLVYLFVESKQLNHSDEEFKEQSEPNDASKLS